MSTRCDFCAIAAGHAPAVMLYRGNDAVAFFPDNPATPGHTLIVPSQHSDDLFDVERPDELASLMHVSVVLGRAIRAALNPHGMNLITSAGTAASQSVFHAHIHLVPRWKGDRMGDIWPTDEETSSDLKNEWAERIRSELSTLT